MAVANQRGYVRPLVRSVTTFASETAGLIREKVRFIRVRLLFFLNVALLAHRNCSSSGGNDAIVFANSLARCILRF